MSSKAKKRKVSMEPVLQDFTVTSFSDLHPDVAGPSDSSLIEEIKNYDVELPEITFNQTADINILSGPYPSDSSLDSLIKPQSNSKFYSEVQHPFRKRSKKKLVEENLFDSCLKDSFSDHSLENVHKPFQRKPKNKVRLSTFDSDLESNTPVKDSPFKKPFQRKYKNKRQSNLFDSLIKDSQPNTPDQQLSRPFQRKPRKKINSDSFDKVFSNDSINQPSPVQNFITRRKNRMKKIDCNNLFDDDLASSQSDVSIPLQPLSLKLKTASNHTKNNTGMFDDLLNATGNESQNENPSVLDPCNKHDYLNEGNTKSFSLEYHEETGGSTKVDDFSKEEKMEPDTEDGKTNHYKENKNENENRFISELSDQQNTSIVDECLQPNNNDKSVVCSSKQSDVLDYEKEKREKKEKEKCELPNQQDPLEHRSEHLGYGGPRAYEEEEVDFTAGLPNTVPSETQNQETIQSETHDEETLQSETQGEETLNSETQDDETLQSETQDEETLQFETQGEETLKSETQDEETLQSETQGEESLKSETQDEETLQSETQDEETLQFEIEGEETWRSEENKGESGSIAELPNPNYLPDEGKAKEIENSRKTEYFTDSVHQLSSCIKNSQDINRALEGDDSARDTEPREGISQYNVSIAKELNLVENIHIHTMSLESRRPSLPCTGEMTTNEHKRKSSVFQTFSLPSLYSDFEPSLAKLNYREMIICTPDGSFKDMPSSTPNVKGKRVSFLLKEETCLRDSKENNVDSNGTSTRRKSSLRSHKGNNDLTKDNSIHLRKRRVSFKVDSREVNSLNQLNVKNSGKLERSMGNQSSNCYSSVSLDSLVYVEQSGSKTSDSESVYIDIHPSRGKSTSSSNTESFSSCKKKVIVELSKSQANSTRFKTNSCASDTERCEYEGKKLCNEKSLHIEEGHGNSDNNCVEEKTIENTNNKEEFSSSENELEGERDEESYVEEEEPAIEEEELDVEEEESNVEEKESNVEEDESNVEEEESNVEEEEEEGESEEKRLDTTAEQLESEQESVEEQNLVAEDQETEIHSNDRSGHVEFEVNNYVLSCEQDENLNPGIKIPGEFKLPYNKKMRSSSLFKEKLIEVPSKSHLQDILNNIPLSEFKKRNRRKLSEHCISREQMQQYEIEEELMKNQKKKTQNQPHLTFFASSKLKRPKKWVSPKLYDFLINKLKPQYGLRSRVRAEELVLFLVEHVECIKKKKELMGEDVEVMKVELARLGIIKTHWDFFKFINHYFEYNFKEKLYPSLPGVSRSAFEFGPTNVMENILESV